MSVGVQKRPAEPAGRLSADAQWWWDGQRWLRALSPDGLWRWDGEGWRMASDLDTSDPAALAEGLDALVGSLFAEGGQVLALRAHEWRADDPELAEMVARAAPLAARLSAIDAQLAGLEAGGGRLGLRSLLGGGEREQLESEARAIEAELRPLAALIGRLAPEPSLKDADELLAPARRLSKRVLELAEALAEERRLAAEHEERTEGARRRLEEVRAEREAGLRELEAGLRARELEHAQAVAELEAGLRRVRMVEPGARLVEFGGIVLLENRLDTPDGRGPVEGARARVASARELWDSEREAMLRLGLVEAVHSHAFHDAVAGRGDDLFLLVTTPMAATVVPVGARVEDAARDFARRVEEASAEAAPRRQVWDAQVAAAEAALNAALADTRAVDEARAAFEAAASDPERNRPVEDAEAEVKRVSRPTAAHDRARARVEEVAERLLAPPSAPLSA